MGKRIPNEEVLKTYNEIILWEKKIIKPSTLRKIGDTIAKPLDFVIECLPNGALQPISKAIEGMFGILLFASDYTFSDLGILKSIEKYGGEKPLCKERIKGQNITCLKKAATTYISENNILATLQGFGCGLGGVGLIAADIPLLFGIAFRVIQQIGSTFGYDMSLPEEKHFIMKIIDLGTSLPTAPKIEAMLGKEAFKEYVKKTTFKEMGKIAAVKNGQMAVEELAIEMLKAQGKRATKKAIEEMSQKIVTEVAKNGVKASAVISARETAKDVGKSLTKRKLGQLIPILGGVVGAGFNYWFIWSVGETAYHAYLKRHIDDNYLIEG